MKIDINFNGLIAAYTVNGKSIDKLSVLEIYQLLRAFKCVEREAHSILASKYKTNGTIYKNSSKNITKV